MKLQQGQVWKVNQQFLRIVELERLAVGYKVMDDLINREGNHHKVTKKEFCRLVKNGVVLTAAQVRHGLQGTQPSETGGSPQLPS